MLTATAVSDTNFNDANNTMVGNAWLRKDAIPTSIYND
jgi:hypothetical protein